MIGAIHNQDVPWYIRQYDQAKNEIQMMLECTNEIIINKVVSAAAGCETIQGTCMDCGKIFPEEIDCV